MSLKDIVKAANSRDKKGGILVPLITEYLNNKDHEKPLYPFWARDCRNRHQHLDKRFHPSQIASDFCGREWCIEQYELAITPKRTVDAKTQRIFEIGNSYHTMVQGWFAQMGRLYGMWECMNCGEEHWGVSVTKCRTCSNGDVPDMIYREVPIDDAETWYLAHCDGEVLTGGQDAPVKLYGIEIKSCHSRVYESVQMEPLRRHCYQAYQYLWVRGRAAGRQKGEPVRKHKIAGCIVLYINKETGDLKEHLLEMTDAAMAQYITPNLAQMQEAREFEPGKLKTLPHRICETYEEGEFRKCPVVDPCFISLPPKVKK